MGTTTLRKQFLSLNADMDNLKIVISDPDSGLMQVYANMSEDSVERDHINKLMDKEVYYTRYRVWPDLIAQDSENIYILCYDMGEQNLHKINKDIKYYVDNPDSVDKFT